VYSGSLLRGRRSLGAVLAVLFLGWLFGRGPGGLGRAQAPKAPRPGSARPSAPSAAPERTRPAADGPALPGAFGSAAGCAAAVSAGQRLPRAPGSARFASWNLHWFPDGKPGQSGSGADLKWLACALSWLDADVVAVQEVKQSPEAVQALAAVLSELNRLSGARFTARFDDCGRRVPQHVGLVWNEARVAARDFETVAALNPHGDACQSQLRPGFAARFHLPGGLDLEAVSAHFKSMADEHGYALRSESFAAIPGVLRALTAKAQDADFLLLGDLNTMGCDACSPKVSAASEVAAAEKLLSAGGLRLVPADAAGSELYEGHLTLLDHAVASRAMRELSPDARTHVAGACAAGAAAPSGRAAKRIRSELSDHCPIVLDLSDHDFD
jgi:endonuclease/exonuclease/phosphatase family metal-dependent hydrolase